MRIMIKGGVWKNTEDEILKVAVMKYGKNQWARISSLLVRKSPKQCKARWFEWLDPSIKKTEWTREEEEKLLHLAKILPTQWRTIAPIIGRTAAQCLEHYEKLLDQAQNKELADIEDPRRLRPGEIDPNPEGKPARPDPMDMDEDEKEMLSEARARLANTKGKKAKRKAREKALEEARRLASLQKRRELRAAGIEVRKYKRKRRGIDYNEEIPFEKVPARGFFDVTEERKNALDMRNDPKFLGADIEDVDEQRRDLVEERERKKDAKREKLYKASNLPEALLKINKLNDPEQISRRTQMVLPAPQISDTELEDIAKLGSMLPPAAVSASGPTKTLISRYDTPVHKPARTPMRTPIVRDVIMEEAQNIIALNQQTPLLGEENSVLHPSDFGRLRREQTPSAMAPGTGGVTPGRAMTGMTPSSGTTPRGPTPLRGQSPAGTPIRDQLHINDPQALSTNLTAEQALQQNAVPVQKRKREELQNRLQMNFASLPEPQMEYSLTLPSLPSDSELKRLVVVEEDAEDAQARKAAEAAADKERAFRRRSQVIQRDLPRPVALNPFSVKADAAEQLVQTEAFSIMYFDEALEKGKPVKMPEYSDEQLLQAKELVALEVASRGGLPSQQTMLEGTSLGGDRVVFVPSLKRFCLWSESAAEQKLEAIKAEFRMLRGQLKEEASNAQNLEKKVSILLGGYAMRSQKQRESMIIAGGAIAEAATNLLCFEYLQSREAAAVPTRLAYAKQQADLAQEHSRNLQAEYGKLCVDLQELQGKAAALANA